MNLYKYISQIGNNLRLVVQTGLNYLKSIRCVIVNTYEGRNSVFICFQEAHVKLSQNEASAVSGVM